MTSIPNLTWEIYMDSFGQWRAIASERDADGKRVFTLESEACTAAIKENQMNRIDLETRIRCLEAQRERAEKFLEQGGAT
jgi:hypothetical protein